MSYTVTVTATEKWYTTTYQKQTHPKNKQHSTRVGDLEYDQRITL